MVRFEWKSQIDGIENLFVGVHDQPIATIFTSSSGKQWSYLVQIPGITDGWRKYIPKDVLKIKIEKGIDDWISYACMDMPAQEKEKE